MVLSYSTALQAGESALAISSILKIFVVSIILAQLIFIDTASAKDEKEAVAVSLAIFKIKQKTDDDTDKGKLVSPTNPQISPSPPTDCIDCTKQNQYYYQPNQYYHYYYYQRPGLLRRIFRW